MSGWRATIRRVASTPPMPGIRLSMITIRGASASTASIAASPDSASPASASPGVAATRSRSAFRNVAWSSTMSTPTGRESPMPCSPAPPCT